MNDSSKLPLTFLKRTDKFISSLSFSSNDIARIIRDLGSNKAHGHDVIVFLCSKFVVSPFQNF